MRILLFLITILCFIQNSEATPLYTPNQEKTTISKNENLGSSDFEKLSKKELEKNLGRKLKLKEKVALFFMKRKVRKDEKSKITWKDILGLLGVSVLTAIASIILLSIYTVASPAGAIVLLFPIVLGVVLGITTKKKKYYWLGLISFGLSIFLQFAFWAFLFFPNWE